MPWFALIGHDGPDGAALRKKHRPAHLEGLAALDAEGRVRHGGPLLDEDGAPCGSVVIFEAADLAAARDVVARDPYVQRGVFARVELRETKPVFSGGRG